MPIQIRCLCVNAPLKCTVSLIRQNIKDSQRRRTHNSLLWIKSAEISSQIILNFTCSSWSLIAIILKNKCACRSSLNVFKFTFILQRISLKFHNPITDGVSAARTQDVRMVAMFVSFTGIFKCNDGVA
jgi:hypothetical protein